MTESVTLTPQGLMYWVLRAVPGINSDYVRNELTKADREDFNIRELQYWTFRFERDLHDARERRRRKEEKR